MSEMKGEQLTKGETNMRHHCCYIGEVTKVECGNEAEWQIWYGESPDDSTESCTRHVGEMLTDAPEHRIYPAEKSDD